MTIVEFITARLDEDEAAANAADPGPWEVGSRLGGRDSMVYIREQGDLIDTVGITYRDPVFTSQVPNKTRFRENAVHIALHDPARVLREIEHKRAVLALHKPNSHRMDEWTCCYHCNDDYGDYRPYPCDDIRLLAAIWNDHPDYDPAWAVKEVSGR